MIIVILSVAFVVIILFVIGVSFLIRGYAKLPHGDSTASAGDLQKARADLQTAHAEQENLREQANTLAVQIEEMKGKLTWAENNITSLEETNRKSSQAQSKITQLETDLRFLSQKADTQAREAIDVITRLAAEAEILKTQNTEKAASVELTELTDENAKLKIQITGYDSKVKELETAVRAANDSSQKLAEMTKSSQQFTAENTQLKKSMAEIEAKLQSAQKEAEQFKQQHEQIVLELQEKLKILEQSSAEAPAPQPVPSADTAVVEEELNKVRAQGEKRMVQANAALVKLNSDLDFLNTQIAEKDRKIKSLSEDLLSTRNELAVSLRHVVQMKKSVSPGDVAPEQDTDSGNHDLRKQLEDAIVINQTLKEKEKILTYKLAQSRAQALNLGRLCDALRDQAGRGAMSS